ncbi:MAG: hypothetical protein B6V02_02450 [Thermoprotei archaeon ex4572_64]|nr:MAG: hypothetical protein B6V02_02450 [Thermoprotei archaeon ex4572_64]
MHNLEIDDHLVKIFHKLRSRGKISLNEIFPELKLNDKMYTLWNGESSDVDVLDNNLLDLLLYSDVVLIPLDRIQAHSEISKLINYIINNFSNEIQLINLYKVVDSSLPYISNGIRKLMVISILARYSLTDRLSQDFIGKFFIEYPQYSIDYCIDEIKLILDSDDYLKYGEYLYDLRIFNLEDLAYRVLKAFSKDKELGKILLQKSHELLIEPILKLASQVSLRYSELASLCNFKFEDLTPAKFILMCRELVKLPSINAKPSIELVEKIVKLKYSLDSLLKLRLMLRKVRQAILNLEIDKFISLVRDVKDILQECTVDIVKNLKNVDITIKEVLFGMIILNTEHSITTHRYSNIQILCNHYIPPLLLDRFPLNIHAIPCIVILNT